MPSICVFCGANSGNNPTYMQAATQLGESLARLGVTIIYGGSSAGTMGALAQGALAAGGRVIGVIAREILLKEKPTSRAYTIAHR
jgi:uncharacterized protein (TIGR00730 family)